MDQNVEQTEGNFLERHPRFWQVCLVGAAAVGFTELGLDVADMIIDNQVSLLNVELIPASLLVAGLGVLGTRLVQRDYISNRDSHEIGSSA